MESQVRVPNQVDFLELMVYWKLNSNSAAIRVSPSCHPRNPGKIPSFLPLCTHTLPATTAQVALSSPHHFEQVLLPVQPPRYSQLSWGLSPNSQETSRLRDPSLTNSSLSETEGGDLSLPEHSPRRPKPRSSAMGPESQAMPLA